ncbi:unnamed protein product [Prunus armeniaca]|uniref:Uncharacterized protein n=1 Tax=Prunus armeniaca TaxID=36596 RepID=A0A6J5UCY7_PRUAR|nr:unnamed protein product [Prunus armeniaca]
MGSPQADARSTQMPRHAETARAAYHDRVDGVSAGISTAGLWPPPQSASVNAPSRSADRLVTSFSSFPRGTCLLSVSRPYLALDRIYRPIGAAFPNNPTRRQRLVVRQGPGTTGLSPSPAPPSSGLGPGPLRDASPDYNSDAMGARFSSWAIPGSLAVTRGILVLRVFSLPTSRHRLAGSCRYQQQEKTTKWKQQLTMALGPDNALGVGEIGATGNA